MQKTSTELIGSLKAKGVLQDDLIEKALYAVDRRDFISEEFQDMAYEDRALPIGMGQTISQPYTVVFMLELLQAKKGDIVFDVGHGSGWQTALLAHIVGEKGKVYAKEVIPELCALGEGNVAKYPELHRRVVFECGDASKGATLAPGEQLDRIIAAADVKKVPDCWYRSLRDDGGVLVYPSRGVIKKTQKLTNKKLTVQKYPGFSFVPFVT